jgi:hypothetical protein
MVIQEWFQAIFTHGINPQQDYLRQVRWVGQSLQQFFRAAR